MNNIMGERVSPSLSLFYETHVIHVICTVYIMERCFHVLYL